MEPMFWETIRMNQMRKRKIDIGWMILTSVTVPVEIPKVPPGFVSVGVDPGINFGIAVLRERSLEVFWGKVPRKMALPGMEAIALAGDLCAVDFGEIIWRDVRGPLIPPVYIEGPSYNDTVGQPLLEQMRFGFAVGFDRAGYDPKYLPPMTARKLAFGHGKKAGKDIWITINQNGADAVGLALAGLEIYAGSAGLGTI